MPMTRHRDPKADGLAHLSLFAGCTRKELATIASLTYESQVGAGAALCTREPQTHLHVDDEPEGGCRHA